MNKKDVSLYMKAGVRAHLVGIGGVSMSPLAEVLHGAGVIVSGSDINDGEAVAHLRSLGITVAIGHRAENVAGVDFVVRTAAARDDNPEISAARAAGIPVFERAEAWGSIMRSYRNAVCISGTHGKTTTTSMTTHILMAASADPTVMIGGTLPLLNAGHRVGKGDTIVLESCEYYNSFHSFFPTVAVILNVDTDHLDFFKSFANIKASFGKFASLVPEDGYVVVNYDDPNAMDVVSWRQKRVITFGLGEGADVRGVNIVVKGIMSEFDILYKGELFTHVRLSLVGQHNIYNALAASSAAIALGIPAEFISEGLSLFRGAKRRFEFKGRVNGADVFDDYAHHPSELHALLDAACSLDYKRVIVAFQPHTYSRTQAHFDSFVSELKRADVAFLAEIYAAREQNTIGISSKQLADAVPGAEYYSDFAELEARLRGFAREGDIIVTVGAGDIYKVGEAIV